MASEEGVLFTTLTLPSSQKPTARRRRVPQTLSELQGSGPAA